MKSKINEVDLNQIINDLKKENARLNYILSQNRHDDDENDVREKVKQLENERESLMKTLMELKNNNKEESHDSYLNYCCLWNLDRERELCGKKFWKIQNDWTKIGNDTNCEIELKGFEYICLFY